MTATRIIEQLGLAPHPEGGWYSETARRGSIGGDRAAMTAIHFLLEQGERSRWHRVDADELWLWHAGSPLTLSIADGAAPVDYLLGGDVSVGQRPQLLVPSGAWQSAEAPDGWALVSCVVVPGFEFAGFELAPGDVLPGGG